MTDSGCVECAENTYNGDGKDNCTACPDGMVAPAGSTTEDDCYYGK